MKESPYNNRLNFYYGQVDYLQQHLSAPARADIDKTIELLGDVKFLPIPLKVAIEGITVSIDALRKKINNPNQIFDGCLHRFVSLHIELSEQYQKNNFKNFMILEVKPSERIWQLFVRIGNAANNYSDELKEFLGAYFLLRLDGNQTVRKDLPAILFKFSNGGRDALRDSEWMALEILLVKVRRDFSENVSSPIFDQEQSFEELVAQKLRNKLEYADDKAKQGALDYKTLSIPVFCSMAAKLRSECEVGNNSSAKILLASFIGIPFKHIDKLPLLRPESEDWGIVFDPVEGVIKFDLDLVLPNGAKGNGNAYIRSSTILVKPLPEFLRVYLNAKLSRSIEYPRNIGELLGNGIDSEYSYEKVAKFINSVARVAIQFCDTDPYLAGLIANDFRILPKSKGYYKQTTRKDLWNASAQFFQQIGWGDPAPQANGLNFGSQAVISDDAIRSLFERLAIDIQNKPSNNANISRVLSFHNKFTTYVGCLSVFSLVLRGSKKLPIYVDAVSQGQSYILVNDKNVHGKASLQPVTINRVLRDQFSLYILHCQSLFKRLKTLKNIDRNFIKALLGIISNEHVPLLVTTEQPFGISTASLIKNLGENLVGNFGRHYWETNFSQHGITSRESAAHLRHQSASNFNWDHGSDLILSDLNERIGKAQVDKLISLDIRAVAGLSGRFMK